MYVMYIKTRCWNWLCISLIVFKICLMVISNWVYSIGNYARTFVRRFTPTYLIIQSPRVILKTEKTLECVTQIKFQWNSSVNSEMFKLILIKIERDPLSDIVTKSRWYPTYFYNGIAFKYFRWRKEISVSSGDCKN